MVAGAGDQAANGVAVGAIDPGVVGLSFGTSGVVFTATKGPSSSRRGGCMRFAMPSPDVGILWA